MTLLRYVVIGLVALVAALGLGIVLFLEFADFDGYRADVEQGIADATGMELSIDGDFELDAGRAITLTATDLVFRNPSFAGAKELARVRRLHLVLDTWSFVSGPVALRTLEVDGLHVNFARDPDGAGNWQAVGPDADTGRDAEDRSGQVVLYRLLLTDADVRLPVGDGPGRRIRLDRLAAERRPNGDLQFALEGALDTDDATAPLLGSGFLHGADGRIELADSVLTVAGSAVTARGFADPGREPPAAQLELGAEGPSLAATAAALGVGGLPDLPFSLGLAVAAGGNGFEVNDGRLKLGNSEFSASAAVDLGGDRPVLRLNVSAPLLDLRPARADTDQAAAAGESRQAEPPGRLFSDEPLAFAGLAAADVSAEVFADRVVTSSGEWRDFNAVLAIANGGLTIEPFAVASGDGGFEGRLQLVPDADGYALDLAGSAENLRLGALAAAGQDPATIPPLDLDVTLQGRGRSLHAIMSSASGAIRGVQRSGRINLQAAGFLFADLVSSIFRALNPLDETTTETNLECGIYDIAIADGVATVGQLALQSKRLTIVGSGTADLASERLDLTFRTRTREGFGVSLGSVANSFLKIGGTLAAPAIGVDAAGSVTTAGAAVATGGLSVLARGLWDRLSAEADLCSSIRRESAEVQDAE